MFSFFSFPKATAVSYGIHGERCGIKYSLLFQIVYHFHTTRDMHYVDCGQWWYTTMNIISELRIPLEVTQLCVIIFSNPHNEYGFKYNI